MRIMSRRLLLLTVATVVLFAAGAAEGQTVERTINLDALGWGGIQAYPVDTDASAATEEWAVVSTQYGNPGNTWGQWRVIAVRAGGLCVGDWFDPRPAGIGRVGVARINGVDKLIVNDSEYGEGPQRLTIVSLNTPSCKH
jgi:hypothetical protein